MRSIHDPRYQRVIQKLRQVRRTQRLTQAEVAEALGWPRTMLSNAETCQRRLDLLELHALARHYGLRLRDFEACLHS